ncbi:MAG: NADH-quinone oxidoreductase subunit A [Candidatus Omnitrophica bacterium]|nr:NADH-quinone oxidoreductase subunit A [Candidatus Omnitrophota bacterium]
MLHDYIPILILAGLAAAFAIGTVLLSFLIGPRKSGDGKLDPYECGMPPEGDPRERFNVKFFLVAMVFVIFDIEIVFLFLWAVIFQQLGVYGLLEMAVFIGILIMAFAYVWKKGVLEWASRTNSST